MKQLSSIDLKCLGFESETQEYSRKVKEETLIRSLFYSFKHQIKGHPKKEYLRCKLIRFHKRANRKLKKGKKLYNSIEKLSLNSEFYWKQCQEVHKKRSGILDRVSLAQFEPVKFKPNAKPTCLNSRSFNSEFCVKYFQNEAVRESYFFFVEYLFSEFDPVKLGQLFGFSCCREGVHTLDCAHKWLLMKRYASYFMIDDLKLKPWEPEGWIPLPSLRGFDISEEGC